MVERKVRKKRNYEHFDIQTRVRGIIHKNKKRYTRKTKHKKEREE
jgi:hypothetical protein